MIGEDRLIHFSGVAMGEACTIVLRGASAWSHCTSAGIYCLFLCWNALHPCYDILCNPFCHPVTQQPVLPTWAYTQTDSPVQLAGSAEASTPGCRHRLPPRVWPPCTLTAQRCMRTPASALLLTCSPVVLSLTHLHR